MSRVNKSAGVPRSHILHAGRMLAMAIGCLILTVSVVHSQTQTQAEILGVVTDESGAVLPGVTITAASPALQVREVVVVTDARGEYRITALPIGAYRVTYVLPGFQTAAREDVRLPAGFTAKIDVSLKVGALDESITVSGQSPVVDVASTRPSTSLTRETLELIPTSRNGLQAVISQAPGVRSNLDVGGNTTGAGVVWRAFGQQTGQWALIEGVATTASGYAGIYQDYAATEEAQVSTLGNDAETPTRGIAVNMIIKSGGNAFHAEVADSFTKPWLVSNNIDASLEAQGITQGIPILARWDAGGELGGRVVKDKLWFFSAARHRRNILGVEGCLKPDGSVCDHNFKEKFYSGKVTYQINRAHRFITYYQRYYKDERGGANGLTPWDSRYLQSLDGKVGKGEWQGTFGDRVIANVMYGYWDYDSRQYGFSTAPSATDIVTLRNSGNSPAQPFFGSTTGIQHSGPESVRQVSGSVSWYVPDLLFGSHSLKVGLDRLHPQNLGESGSHTESGDYILRFRSGVPYQVNIYSFPVTTRLDDVNTGVYVKDQWRMGPRLTLNLGMRVAHDVLYVPEASKPASPIGAGATYAPYAAATFPRIDFPNYNTIVPRVHAAYDVTGDGKTVIKGGYGRFVANRRPNDGAFVSPNKAITTTYTWRDLNGNLNYDNGEVNLDPNGPDFITNNAGVGVLNPDQKPAIADEFTLSFERQLVSNVAVRLTGVYSTDRNVTMTPWIKIPYEAYTIPITNADPGPDGRLGTADDTGKTITYYEYPTSLRGAVNQVPITVNEPRMDTSFKSFEAAFAKRLSNKWQAMASYSTTKLHVPGSYANPNTRLFTDNDTTEWEMKTSGSYELPAEVLGSLSYELRSGVAWQRTALFSGGVTIPSIVLPVEPLGSQHYDNVHLLNGRVRKEFHLYKQTLSAQIDVFNLLNINTVIAVTAQSGANFGKATTSATRAATSPYINGRLVNFGFSWKF